MIARLVCPRCWQPNEVSRTFCWQCSRSFQTPATREEYERRLSLHAKWSPDDLKLGYHHAAMMSHPDRHPDDHDAVVKFQFVNQAYEALSKIVNVNAYAHPSNQSSAPFRTDKKSTTDESQPINLVLSQLQTFYDSRFGPRDPIKDQIIVLVIVFSAIALFGLFAAWIAHHYK